MSMHGTINTFPTLQIHSESSSQESNSGDSELAIKESTPKLKKPPKFGVILHNDDYTTMEFVIEVLQRFFNKSGDVAARIMLEVHEKGQGIAGIYARDVAETKVVQVTEYAREHQYPLKVTMRSL